MNYSLSSGTHINTIFIWKKKKQSSNEMKKSNGRRAVTFVIKERTDKPARFQRTQNTLSFIEHIFP